MKKVLFILGMAATIVACTNVQKSETITNDSITIVVDSVNSTLTDSLSVDSLIVE